LNDFDVKAAVLISCRNEEATVDGLFAGFPATLPETLLVKDLVDGGLDMVAGVRTSVRF